MKTFDKFYLFKRSVAEELCTNAMLGVYDGSAETVPYLESCTGLHQETGTLLIITREITREGMNCIHLLISFRSMLDPRIVVEFDEAIAGEWIEVFFGDAQRLIVEDKGVNNHHYRVFCDENWQPIQL